MKNCLRCVTAVILLALFVASCGSAPAPTAAPTAAPTVASAAPTTAPAPTNAPPPTQAPPTQIPATAVPPTPTAVAPKVGGTLVVALGGDPDTLDPQKSAQSFQMVVNQYVGAGLIIQEPATGNLVGYLAEKWSVSKDGLAYEFTLKKGVKFHDGTPMTARDYVYTYQRALDPATRSPSTGSALKGVSKVEAPDDYTLRLTLSAPNAPLLQNMTMLAWHQPLQKAWVEKWGDQYGRHPMSVGPFKFKEWSTGEKIVLERNPDFAWGPSYSRGGAPYIQTIEFRILPEAATVLAGLEAGELGLASVGAQDIGKFEGRPEYSIVEYQAQGVNPVVHFNTSKPPFDDVRVRQAFNLAVDRQALIKVVAAGRAIPQFGPISPPVATYWAGVEKIGYGFDLPKAKDLMKQAGFTLGANGMLEKGGQPLKMTIVSYAYEESSKTAEVLQAQLKALGVELTIQTKEPSALNADFRAGDYVIGVSGWTWPDASIMYVLFNSATIGTLNFSRVKDPDLDKLLADMVAAPDQETYVRSSEAAQKRVVEQAYIIPLFTAKYSRVLKSSVKGYYYSNLTGQMDLFDAYIVQK